MIFKMHQTNLETLISELSFIQNVDAKLDCQYPCEMQASSTFHPNYNTYPPPTMTSLIKTTKKYLIGQNQSLSLIITCDFNTITKNFKASSKVEIG